MSSSTALIIRYLPETPVNTQQLISVPMERMPPGAHCSSALTKEPVTTTFLHLILILDALANLDGLGHTVKCELTHPSWKRQNLLPTPPSCWVLRSSASSLAPLHFHTFSSPSKIKINRVPACHFADAADTPALIQLMRAITLHQSDLSLPVLPTT